MVNYCKFIVKKSKYNKKIFNKILQIFIIYLNFENIYNKLRIS